MREVRRIFAYARGRALMTTEKMEFFSGLLDGKTAMPIHYTKKQAGQALCDKSV